MDEIAIRRGEIQLSTTPLVAGEGQYIYTDNEPKYIVPSIEHVWSNSLSREDWTLEHG